jgi:hypothetical protein
MEHDESQPLGATPWSDLPVAFAAWWWQRHATRPENPKTSLLAQRCAPTTLALSGLGFGAVKEWRWAMLALMPMPQRLECASLYAVMLSAGSQHTPALMTNVDTIDQQWALGVGSIQPLPRRLDWSNMTDVDSCLLGCAEIGSWVQEEFPLLWKRLVTEFDPSIQQALDRLMQSSLPPSQYGASMRQRVARCWALTNLRTENRHGIHSREIAAA